MGMTAIPAASAQTSSLDAKFQIFWGKSRAHPCAAFFCGEGTLEQFGAATFTFNPVSGSDLDASGCFDIVAFETITLEDGSGTITLRESGSVCYPSPAAANAPRSSKSFGNPTRVTLTYNVVDGSGIFAGAGGSGTVIMRTAGESGHKEISGTVTL